MPQRNMWSLSRGEKYREHLLEIRLCFEITSPALIHCSGLRKLNNLWSIVTLGLEAKRAGTRPDGGI